MIKFRRDAYSINNLHHIVTPGKNGMYPTSLRARVDGSLPLKEKAQTTHRAITKVQSGELEKSTL